MAQSTIENDYVIAGPFNNWLNDHGLNKNDYPWEIQDAFYARGHYLTKMPSQRLFGFVFWMIGNKFSAAQVRYVVYEHPVWGTRDFEADVEQIFRKTREGVFDDFTYFDRTTGKSEKLTNLHV